MSNSMIVALPILDHFLDRRGVLDVFVKNLPKQFRHFRVGGEAQSDHLLDRQVVDSAEVLGREKAFHACAHLGPNDAVLQSDGVAPQEGQSQKSTEPVQYNSPPMR